MNRRIIASLLVLACLGAGCLASRLPIGDPKSLVQSLIDRNGLKAVRIPLPRLPLPQGDDWSHLKLMYFPGGLAVDWQTGPMAEPLLFSEDGRFLANVFGYLPTSLTGRGGRDLVTADWTGSVNIVVRSLDRPIAAPRVLASMKLESYGSDLFPVPMDFAGDQVYQLYGWVPVYSLLANPDSLRGDHELRGLLSKMDRQRWVCVIWSLRSSVPRVVLALKEEVGLPPFPPECHANMLCFPDGERDRAVTWDPSTNRFDVSSLPASLVLVNRPIEEPLLGEDAR